MLHVALGGIALLWVASSNGDPSYLGRGPTKARTSIAENTVVVVLEDTLTKAERSLVDNGDHDEVRRVRQRFQRTMRADLVAAVEALTGRSVLAFMSDTHIAPDLACEVFVLEPDPAAEPLDDPEERRAGMTTSHEQPPEVIARREQVRRLRAGGSRAQRVL